MYIAICGKFWQSVNEIGLDGLGHTQRKSLFLLGGLCFFHSVGEKNCFGNVQTVHVMLLKKKKAANELQQRSAAVSHLDLSSW